MSESNQTVESSSAAIPQAYNGPTERSVYHKNWELDNKPVALYKEKQTVYLRGPRGVDPKPYKIYKIVGDGQYQLSRDKRADKTVYEEADLQTVP